MTSRRFLALALIALAASAPAAPAAQTAAAAPIALHPENPHYFLWRGRPTILITSAEHYGAVINLDFDYRKYLDTLAADGLNYTRVFSGAYVEPQGAFKIERNTLAPGPGRFLAPWARASQPGYPNGGNRFDLSRWDDAYFARLKDFVSRAAARNIVVELSLFCPMYEEVQWSLSPMNRANNVNGVGGVGRNEVYTLDKEPALLAVQEGLTRKLVTELNAFDNLFFEIANEPYFGGVTMAWQHRIADVIVETERALPAKHLIAQNIANKSAKIAGPHPAVSIFNFHYASPPETVAMNYGLNKAIGDDETGFRGVSDDVYRMEGVGLRHRRRRVVQQSRLLVRCRLRGRDVRVPGVTARRRQQGAAAPVEGPHGVHRRLRFSADGAGQHRHHGGRAARRQRAGAGRTRPGDGDLPAEETRGRIGERGAASA